MMLKKILLVLLLSTLHFVVKAQGVELSPLSKISVLTVGTGDELAAKFGHSAIRVQDPILGIDEVYGYGTYDFEDANFYLNFTRGKLAYTIARMPFKYFNASYTSEQRWIREQTLNLTVTQRTDIILFLEHNLKPENRKYKYDFLFDNCATRIPAVLEKTLGSGISYNYNHLKDNLTFRQLLRQNLDPNTWSNYGIDLALGSVIDRKALPKEHMFLPLYVNYQLKNTLLNGSPIVKEETLVLDVPEKENHSLFFLTPAFWLGLLLVVVLWITYRDYKNNSRSRWLDFSLFLITGLAGFLILFLWFATDHWATKINFNSLWAFAPNLVVAFYVLRKETPSWLEKYLLIVLLFLVGSIVIWIFKIQVFSILMILVLSALAIRYIFLYGHFKNATKKNQS